MTTAHPDTEVAESNDVMDDIHAVRSLIEQLDPHRQYLDTTRRTYLTDVFIQPARAVRMLHQDGHLPEPDRITAHRLCTAVAQHEASRARNNRQLFGADDDAPTDFMWELPAQTAREYGETAEMLGYPNDRPPEDSTARRHPPIFPSTEQFRREWLTALDDATPKQRNLATRIFDTDAPGTTQAQVARDFNIRPNDVTAFLRRQLRRLSETMDDPELGDDVKHLGWARDAFSYWAETAALPVPARLQPPDDPQWATLHLNLLNLGVISPDQAPLIRSVFWLANLPRRNHGTADIAVLATARLLLSTGHATDVPSIQRLPIWQDVIRHYPNLNVPNAIMARTGIRPHLPSQSYDRSHDWLPFTLPPPWTP